MSLTMKGIEKAFDSNIVLKGVDLTLEKGEIRALIGENGAGKSTLMNILGGVIPADKGEISIDGQVKKFLSPRDSMNAGIAFIHQELNLVTDLSIYENLFIGREKKNGLFLDRKFMIREAEKVLKRMNVDLDPRTMVHTLDASYKQIIEIARALLMESTTIIMDEPTTSLTEVEIERVFNMMRTLKSQGVSIIFISHKLPEILTICDTFSVLRDGVLVLSGNVEDATEASLARAMIGHDVRTEKLSRNASITTEALSVHNLSSGRAFKNISFTLKKGEILGFTGLLGDGRSELFQTVFGANPDYTGEIRVKGKPVKMRNTRNAYKSGIGYVPRDRKENGIIKDLTILENGSIVTYEQLSRFLLIDHKKERAQMEMQKKNLSIKLDSLNHKITSLSGGNQQKVVLAKWLNADPDILIFDNPTQGVDVGAKEEIYDIILSLSEQGKAICILSSEAQEIIRLCDRAIVMFHGEIRGELDEDKLTDHNIMLLATGGRIEQIGEEERV
ncbi:MAG: sugar ABC transporter ATP-binding protein [Clostridia bacterium]|nr:sugar ABC transporter ATP-binding protein [Clostridia bacterium]